MKPIEQDAAYLLKVLSYEQAVGRIRSEVIKTQKETIMLSQKTVKAHEKTIETQDKIIARLENP